MNAKPIPGTCLPPGYYLLPYSETLRYGDRFLSVSGNWVRTESVGAPINSGLQYARPTGAILEQEEREALFEQAARVPKLTAEVDRLYAEIRELESRVSELESENDYLKGKDVLDQ